MSTTWSAARRADRASRLAVVESLRELLRQHGKGGTLVEVGDSLIEERAPDGPRAPPPLSTPCGKGMVGDLVNESALVLPSPPRPGSVGVISGAWSSGKTTLALREVAEITCKGHRAAIVDGTGWLHPPALALMRGDLSRTLFIQPHSARSVWAAEQVLRSGLFQLVAILEHRELDRSALRRLQLAAERGVAAGLVVQRSFTGASGGLVAKRYQVEADPPEADPLPRVAAPSRRYRVRLLRRGEGEQSTARRGDLKTASA